MDNDLQHLLQGFWKIYLTARHNINMLHVWYYHKSKHDEDDQNNCFCNIEQNNIQLIEQEDLP